MEQHRFVLVGGIHRIETFTAFFLHFSFLLYIIIILSTSYCNLSTFILFNKKYRKFLQVNIFPCHVFCLFLVKTIFLVMYLATPSINKIMVVTGCQFENNLEFNHHQGGQKKFHMDRILSKRRCPQL